MNFCVQPSCPLAQPLLLPISPGFSQNTSLYAIQVREQVVHRSGAFLPWHYHTTCDSIVISLIPAEQTKTWRQQYSRPRPPLRDHSVDVARSICRDCPLILSCSMAAGHPGLGGCSLGRSDCRPFGLCPLPLSLPFPFVLPKPPRKILLVSPAPPARPAGRPGQSSPPAVISSVGRRSPIRWKLLPLRSLSRLSLSLPHCPSHKFEYSTWPERASVASAAHGLEGVLFPTESEVIPSRSLVAAELMLVRRFPGAQISHLRTAS